MGKAEDLAQQLNVLRRVLPEDVLQDQDGFLNNQRILLVHCLDQRIEALISCALNSYCQSSNGPDTEPNELYVHFLDVLLKLKKDLIDCLLIGQSH